MKNNRNLFRGVLIVWLAAVLFLTAATPQQALNPHPPDHVVKLIFIHHSTGGNWLADPSENELGGDLGRALMENNYYVSATNYGWGPDSIGDATDIPNWLDWFRGPNSETYLNALYTESGQNFGDFGSWPRLSNDPGGENEIVMFKSCFPNSDLEGNPDDPPDPEGWLSVRHAKYVYNEILKYFAARPDKLFIIITAPPLSAGNTTPEHAANARAFNNWLVEDWLAENSYPYNNVAVFDFYNILTDRDAHYRYHNGQIERILGDHNTLAYPSSDDHPSKAGNQKATEEFVPLLNIFYYRWQENAPAQPAASEPPPLGSETQAPIAPPPSGPAQTSGTIDDFESGAPAGTSGWEAYRGETFPTRFSCTAASDAVHSGTSALKLDFDVPAGSWATCVLSYGNPQDWSRSKGLSFYLRADQPAIHFNMLLYSGTPESQETYIYYLDTPEESVNGWARIEVQWADFVRVEWEADAGTSFAHPEQVGGLGFGFDGYEDKSNTGVIWADDIQLLNMGSGQPSAEETERPQPDGSGGGLPCLGSLLLPLAMIGMALLIRRK